MFSVEEFKKLDEKVQEMFIKSMNKNLKQDSIILWDNKVGYYKDYRYRDPINEDETSIMLIDIDFLVEFIEELECGRLDIINYKDKNGYYGYEFKILKYGFEISEPIYKVSGKKLFYSLLELACLEVEKNYE